MRILERFAKQFGKIYRILNAIINDLYHTTTRIEICCDRVLAASVSTMFGGQQATLIPVGALPVRERGRNAELHLIIVAQINMKPGQHTPLVATTRSTDTCGFLRRVGVGRDFAGSSECHDAVMVKVLENATDEIA